MRIHLGATVRHWAFLRRSSLATESVLEQASELGVAEGHKHEALLAPLAQRIDAVGKGQQRPAGRTGGVTVGLGLGMRPNALIEPVRRMSPGLQLTSLDSSSKASKPKEPSLESRRSGVQAKSLPRQACSGRAAQGMIQIHCCWLLQGGQQHCSSLVDVGAILQLAPSVVCLAGPLTPSQVNQRQLASVDLQQHWHAVMCCCSLAQTA